MRRRARSSPRRTKNGTFIWSAVLFNQQVTVTPTQNVLLDVDDWSAVVGYQKGAVLERIRGTLYFRPSLTLSEPASISNTGFWYIGKNKTDAVTLPDPLQASTYVSEDLLWMDAYALHAVQSTGEFSMHESLPHVIDCKARRKLASDDVITLVTAEVANNDLNIFMTGIVRCLIRLP